jgi:integrase
MSPTDENKRPRYFVEKQQKGGHSLFYWQPSAALHRAGFNTVPLSRDRAEAIRQARALSAKVDQWRGGLPVLAKHTHGTTPWIIDAFKQSPRWAKLRPNTIRNYEMQFRFILRWSASRGDPPMRTITRRDAEQLWREFEARGEPAVTRHVIHGAAMLWNYALVDHADQEIVTRNPFYRLKLPPLKPRKQVWQFAQIDAFCAAACALGHPSMALAVIIGINTAQRPIDIRALRWSQYDGQTLKIRQIKTGTTVEIPVTSQLKIALEDARRARTEGKVVALDPDGPIVAHERTGRAWTNVKFILKFRAIAKAARIPETLQFRDLRRTATVHLSESGCSNQEIASFGGWMPATVGAMLAVYGPATLTMAENARTKLEAYRRSVLEG